MRSIIQKLMRAHASPLTRLFFQSQANRQQELLFLAEDLHHVTTNIREMSSYLNNTKSIAQQVKEARDSLAHKVENKAAAVESKLLENAIPKAKSVILQQMDMVDLKFAYGPAEKEQEVKIPVW